MFRTVPLSIIRSFFTAHTRMVYGIQVYWQLASRIRTERHYRPDPAVQWKTPDDGQRNCPKHVEFYSQNKFEKLVHLVGFITRIYHDAWSPERQIYITPWKYMGSGRTAPCMINFYSICMRVVNFTTQLLYP